MRNEHSGGVGPAHELVGEMKIASIRSNGIGQGACRWDVGRRRRRSRRRRKRRLGAASRRSRRTSVRRPVTFEAAEKVPILSGAICVAS